jgi:hypothetical protein
MHAVQHTCWPHGGAPQLYVPTARYFFNVLIGFGYLVEVCLPHVIISCTTPESPRAYDPTPKVSELVLLF